MIAVNDLPVGNRSDAIKYDTMTTTPEAGVPAPVTTEDLFPAGLLRRAMSDGHVARRTSDDGRLSIYNYTAACHYAGAWNEATLSCRGLIVDEAGRIRARPFGKFFSPSDPHAPLPPVGADLYVTDKWDGSLGIVYRDLSGDVRVATRGAFASEQALEATRIWREKYRDVEIPPGITPLVEIVYPENRVVVDYGGRRDLVLLAVIDIATGADLPPASFGWPGPVAARRSFGSLQELAARMSGERPDQDPEEGFVVRFDTGPGAPHVRYKLKWPAYVELHKVITGLNATRVWTAAAVRRASGLDLPTKLIAHRLHLSPETVEGLLGHTDPVAALIEVVPDEFHGWIEEQLARMESEVDDRIALYEHLVRQAAESGGSAREFAEAAKRLAAEHGVRVGPIFALRHGKPEALLSIWLDFKPAADVVPDRAPP